MFTYKPQVKYMKVTIISRWHAECWLLKARVTGRVEPGRTSRKRPQVSPPLKVQKKFFTMQNYTFAEFSSILQCQLILQGIRMKLENHFYTTGENKTSPEKNSTKSLHRIFFRNFLKSPVSRIAPKTLRSPLCSQNISFLVRIEKGFREKRIHYSA